MTQKERIENATTKQAVGFIWIYSWVIVDARECWKEMLKHQPFGWLISQNGEVNSLIISIDNEGLIIGDRNNGVMGFVTATDLFKIKFADGTPFGVKVEE